jgi:hypothetical protein
VIKEFLCCASLTLLLIGALLLAGLVLLIRLYCEEIVDFLDFIFVSGGSIFNPPLPFITSNIINSGIHQWNVMVPYISKFIELSVDFEMNLYDSLVKGLDMSEIDLFIEDILESSSLFSEIIGNILKVIIGSNPEDLKNLSDISKELTEIIIDNNEILLPTINWFIGPSFDISVPLLESLLLLTTSSSLIVHNTGRNLLEFNNSSNYINMKNKFNDNFGNFNYNNLNEHKSIDNIAITYIRDLKNTFENLQNEIDFNNIIKIAKNIRDISSEIRKKNTGRSSPSNIKDNNDINLEKKQTTNKILLNLLKENMHKSISSYINPKGITNNLKRVINWMGFESLKHINDHLKEEYGNGKGFISSFAPHKHPIFKKLGMKRPDNNNKIYFSEYLEELRITPKEIGAEGRLKNYNTNRKLFQIIPGPPLPPPLNCFETVPLDPLCLIEGLFPLPLDPPPIIEAFLNTDCDCDEYDSSAGYFELAGFNNALLVLQTIISSFFYIPFLSTFIMGITLPLFIEDNLFLDGVTPGDIPSEEELVCAFLHLDYFIFIAIPTIIIITALIYSLGFIWTCFKIYIELRVFKEHQILVDKIIGSEKLGILYDKIFEKELPYTLFNPYVYCYGDPSLDKMPTFWKGFDKRPIYYEAFDKLRVRTSCFDKKYHSDNYSPNEHINSDILKLPDKKYINNNNIKETIFEPISSQKNSIEEEGLINDNQIISTDINDSVVMSNLQKQLVYNSVKKVKPKATYEEIRNFYHMIYPEDHDYRDYNIEELINEGFSEFGCIDINITKNDRKECRELLSRPFIFHSNTIGFENELNNRNKNNNVVIYNNYHIKQN